MSNELTIKLNAEQFEGPLDLLLHLVQSYKVDIFDVPLLSVIEQYLDYISAMDQLDLELAADYMLVASQLMLIKSRRLLPTVSDDFVEETEQLEQDILSQIAEYQQIKDVSDDLKELHVDRARHFSKARTEITAETEINLLHNTTSIDLFLAFSQILKTHQLESRSSHTVVEPETFTIQEKIGEIMNLFKNRKKLKFSDFFEHISSRDELITLFLATLELVKSDLLKVDQKKAFGEILLTKNE
ncbi:MAG: segregation/condensation protein A [Streptococcaceae bacterium]|jgi:segregation and condensation protein A|nr:segregation/condensation protein A [Streptococcaceae bacterium]